ncbi:MAG: integrase family protein [Myxococcaceae bacterium]|nr:integrase family protein [Myxococcaceae bacterium]
MQLALWQQEDPCSRGSRKAGKGGRAPAQLNRRGLPEPTLAQIRAETERLSARAYALNTRKAYQSDWNAFALWCGQHGAGAMPATVDTLRSYIAYLGMKGFKASTIRRKRVAVGLAHAHAGLERPDRDVRVREVEHGLAKTIGAREVGADPLLADDILKIVKTLDDSARSDRDRAIFTLAFAGAFRSSELVALEREHLTFTERGLTVLVAFSKEDQLGRGKTTHIPFGAHPETCPIGALQRWLARVGQGEGPVFRVMHGQVIDAKRMSTRAISRAVQRAVAIAGLRSTERGFSSHSFRKGFITTADARGASGPEIAAHCRYQSVLSLSRYILRDHVPHRRNIAEGML